MDLHVATVRNEKGPQLAPMGRGRRRRLIYTLETLRSFWGQFETCSRPLKIFVQLQ